MGKPKTRKIRDTFILILTLAASVASGAFASDWVISNQNAEPRIRQGYESVAPTVVASSAALVSERAQLADEIRK